MIYVRLAVALAALLFAGFLGYKWGASGLEEARAQLAEAARTGELAKAAQASAQQRLDEQLKVQAGELEARLKAQDSAFAEQKQALQSSLAQANQRVAALAGQRQGVEKELAQTREQMKTADGVRLEELRQREAQLQARERQLVGQQDGLVCLRQVVPDDEVGLLNQVLAGARP
jgi:DNA anti-recombination protein RmuC